MKIYFRSIVALALVLAAVVMASPADAAPPKVDLPYAAKQCLDESTNGCVWDAKHYGFGGGKSYYASPSGEVTYIKHKRAHRMIERWEWRKANCVKRAPKISYCNA